VRARSVSGDGAGGGKEGKAKLNRDTGRVVNEAGGVSKEDSEYSSRRLSILDVTVKKKGNVWRVLLTTTG